MLCWFLAQFVVNMRAVRNSAKKAQCVTEPVIEVYAVSTLQQATFFFPVIMEIVMKC